MTDHLDYIASAADGLRFTIDHKSAKIVIGRARNSALDILKVQDIQVFLKRSRKINFRTAGGAA